MPTERAVSPLPGTLKKLGVITAIRDTQLVEQSLLRTLAPILGVLETSLYRINGQQQVTHILHHSRTGTRDSDGAERISERIDAIRNETNLPEHIYMLIDNVRLLGQACHRSGPNGLIFCYPLRSGELQSGYLVFERGGKLTEVEDAVVTGVLQVYSNYYALLDSSQRDRLTGLHNRYAMEVGLDRLWEELSMQPSTAQTQARRDCYWLGVLDIDHFKQINDQFGHVIGDEILLLVSRVMGKTMRRTDLLFRYGGEEFIAIVEARDLEKAVQLFERLRKAVETYRYPQVGKVTLSGGFSMVTPTVLPKSVLERADRAMYEAKKAGRNRVFHYHTLLEQGVLQELETGSITLF
ncbi:diguanylate cyclase [Pseudoduganella sp. FT25W]|uniref:diguanylate cyclase n=1 Tax=Duganella alba TaxID=2666081 RepID=A0A6L5QJA2_9BURK|nr:GGDEF domain-containing protein [Duganella alba]MRX09863.1 diguanylate cyclase [Duganella alba]MRX17500.1 diguanylate cyclase [Duganella alba]